METLRKKINAIVTGIHLERESLVQPQGLLAGHRVRLDLADMVPGLSTPPLEVWVPDAELPLLAAALHAAIAAAGIAPLPAASGPVQ